MDQGQSVPGAGRILHSGNPKGSSKKKKETFVEDKVYRIIKFIIQIPQMVILQ